jgi:hypothetical protein
MHICPIMRDDVSGYINLKLVWGKIAVCPCYIAVQMEAYFNCISQTGCRAEQTTPRRWGSIYIADRREAYIYSYHEVYFHLYQCS